MQSRTKYLITLALAFFATHLAASGLASAAILKKVCVLTSEEKSSVSIRIDGQDAFGYQGGLYYKGKRVAPFSTGQANGYGTVWWSIQKRKSKIESAEVNQVLFFKGTQLYNPLRSSPPAKEINRLIFVGLGASLYYSPQKENKDLLQAGEGFWKMSNECNEIRFRYGM